MAVVLITGRSSGIGLETALAFARRGDRVYASMRNPAKAGPLRERAQIERLSVDVVTLDVTDAGSVEAAVADIHAEHGAIDVLVNNVGIVFQGHPSSSPTRRSPERCSRRTCGVRRARSGRCCPRRADEGVERCQRLLSGRTPAGIPLQRSSTSPARRRWAR